jgi:single-stranded-DNA-specific exonuclease
MPRIWHYLPHDQAQIRHLAQSLNVSSVLARILAARGLASADQARSFLEPRLNDLHDPELLPGVSDVADRVVAAVRAGRKIVIYGDYDVDGVTATTLLWHCLKLAEARVDYYLPDRVCEGYGLNCEALRRLHADDPNTLVISVDCGITSLREAALARELGLELVVTDHHEPAKVLPEAAGIIHPGLPGASYPFRDLCGAGVAFKLAWAICARLGDGKRSSPRMREFLLAALGLAALGTVADVVPLLGENRLLVRFGLNALRERATPGLKELFRASGLAEKPQIDAEDVAFVLAPRINAAGRMGTARLAVELLTTSSTERAAKLADYLEELNRQRQMAERKILKQARELVARNPAWERDPTLVLAHPEWSSGIVGIVASRIAEQYEKPAVLMAINPADQTAQGSARSYAGFDLNAALCACSEWLISHGGHQAAAGLRLSAANIDTFRQALNEYAVRHHRVTEQDRALRIDAEVGLADLTHKAVSELERLGPFGRGNPKPVFASTRVELAEPPRTMGEGERHLSLRLRHYGKVLRAIAFGRAEWAAQMAAVEVPLEISYAAGINHFRGQQNVELQIVDWKPCLLTQNAAS